MDLETTFTISLHLIWLCSMRETCFWKICQCQGQLINCIFTSTWRLLIGLVLEATYNDNDLHPMTKKVLIQISWHLIICHCVDLRAISVFKFLQSHNVLQTRCRHKFSLWKNYQDQRFSIKWSLLYYCQFCQS